MNNKSETIFHKEIVAKVVNNCDKKKIQKKILEKILEMGI